MLVAKEQRGGRSELRRVTWWRKPFYWGFTQLLRMVGYGYRPALALVPALVVVGVGWAVIERADEVGALVRAAPAVPAAAGAPVQPEVALVPLAYSFEAFVPVVKLGQVEAFRPDMASGGDDGFRFICGGTGSSAG